MRSKTDLAADVGLYVLKEIQTISITPGEISGRYFYFISFRPSISANTLICWMAIRFNFNKRSC